MNQRDQALLDKQLWGVSSKAPVNGGIAGVVSFILVVVFLTGLAIGAGFFAPEKQMQFVWHDTPAAIRF
jgi:hypothetical protein